MPSEDYNKMSASEKKKEDWMNSKWRPMMGWMYMLVCTADFVVFPVLWSLVQALHGGQVTSQWNPITLQGAGLFHMAMGAVLGVAAFGRTQEKMAGANNGGAQLPGAATGTSTFGAAAPTTNSWGSQSLGSGSGFGSAPQTTAVAPAPSWGTTAVASAAPVTTGWGGKKAPPEADYPVIG